MKTQARLKTSLAFVAAIILLCPCATTAAATTALTPPALTLSDNAGNSVTIDGTGAATCAGSCTTTISGAGSPGALTWSGQLGLFTITAASGQSKPALSPPQVNLTFLVTTGSWNATISNPVLHAIWSDVGFSGTGPMIMAVSPLIPAGDSNAVYTGYVDNTNAPFGTGTTVGTIGPTSVSSNTTITGAGPTSEPFSMTEDVVVSMSQDASFTVSFNLIAAPQPALALGCPSASGESGVPYESHLTGRGGIPPNSFSISGGLPATLSLNPSTGEISGTPTAAGSLSFTAQVMDSSENTAQAQCQIVVTTPPAPLALTCPTDPVEEGIPYSSSLIATGGVPPYSFFIPSGSLPPGLALDPSTGAIFGTDSAAIGSFTFGAAAVDSSGNAAGKALNKCMLVAAAPVLTMVAGPNTTPQNVVVNTALGTPLAVVVTDAGGNPVKGASVTFTVTIGPGNIPSGVFTGGDNNNLNTLNSVSVDTDAKGVATAPAFTANKVTGGPYNVRASTPNAKNSVTFKVTNIAGPPFAIKVTGGGGQTAQVGARFAKPLTAQVTDQFGNDVPNVPVAFSAPALPAAGSTFGNPPAAAATVNTDKNGNVSLVATANTAVGGYNITATVGKIAPVTFAMTNIAGNPAKIVPILPTNDPTVQNGMFYATVNTKYSPLVVQVVDQFGNPLNGQKVTFTISNVNVANPGGEFTTNANCPGTLKTCTATTGNNGQATAATITANGVAGGFTVTASLAANGKISTDFNLVNKGKVNVPNVVGWTQAAATTAINKALLNVGNVQTAKSNTVPAGSVISTTPKAPAAVNVGSAVDLVVSSGK